MIQLDWDKLVDGLNEFQAAHLHRLLGYGLKSLSLREQNNLIEADHKQLSVALKKRFPGWIYL